MIWLKIFSGLFNLLALLLTFRPNFSIISFTVHHIVFLSSVTIFVHDITYYIFPVMWGGGTCDLAPRLAGEGDVDLL